MLGVGTQYTVVPTLPMPPSSPALLTGTCRHVVLCSLHCYFDDLVLVYTRQVLDTWYFGTFYFVRWTPVTWYYIYWVGIVIWDWVLWPGTQYSILGTWAASVIVMRVVLFAAPKRGMIACAPAPVQTLALLDTSRYHPRYSDVSKCSGDWFTLIRWYEFTICPHPCPPGHQQVKALLI